MGIIIRNFKKIRIVIVVILLIVFGFLFYANMNRTYSASDVLGDYADLNTRNPYVDIQSIDYETEEIFTRIKIPDETQQKLIEAFKNTRFTKVEDFLMDYDYRINITLNTGYAMFVDSNKNSLVILDTHEIYTLDSASDFFLILKNATKK